MCVCVCLCVCVCVCVTACCVVQSILAGNLGAWLWSSPPPPQLWTDLIILPLPSFEVRWTPGSVRWFLTLTYLGGGALWPPPLSFFLTVRLYHSKFRAFLSWLFPLVSPAHFDTKFTPGGTYGTTFMVQ